MSFFLGLAAGAASAVDKQLQNDMKRTQDRIDGMGQYRVTRRRAEQEKKEKDKKELRDVLQNLAAFTDGDEDKAIQLYREAGTTIAGGNDLYAELLKNKKAGKDISSVLTFAEAVNPKDRDNITDFISRTITPVAPLPLMEEEMKASGMYALFKPDVGKQLMQQVEEEAPLPTVSTTGVPKGRPDARATIDRSTLLAAEEAAETARERKRAEGRFTMEEGRFTTAQAQAEQSMSQTQRAADRLDRLDKENASQQEIENARADLRLAQERERLDLAVASAERDAQAFITSQELQGVTIEQRQLELKKAKEAPQFSTYEAMLVASDQKVATLESIPEAQKTSQQKRDLADATAIRNKALAGIKSVADAESTTTYTPSFSKQSVDSIINSEIKRQLEPVGLVKDIEGKLEYNLEGNELQYIDRMTRALNNVELRVAGIDDVQMNSTIKASRKTLSEDIAKYKKGLLDDSSVTKNQITRDQLKDKEFQKTLNAGDVLQYKKGDTIITTVWTGSRYI